MISANDIKTAVEMLDPTDWENGKPKLVAVQRLTGDETLTAAAVEAALSKETGPAPASKENIAPAAPEVLLQPDGNEDRLTVARREADALKAKRDPTVKAMNALEVQRAELDAAIAAKRAEVDTIDTQIEERLEQVKFADTVKLIQKQTQDRLRAQAEATSKVAAALGVASASIPRAFASPLDASLAAGGKRTTMIVNGKPHLAPHPRSPEGVRNMAQWIHHGTRPQV